MQTVEDEEKSRQGRQEAMGTGGDFRKVLRGKVAFDVSSVRDSAG